MDYDDLLREAARTPFEGWDFSVFGDRFAQGATSWDYRDQVTALLARASAALDLGTGGGEFLASLPQLPERMAATEGYAPNVAVARRRLEPLGVEVAPVSQDESAPLPFPDDSFDVVVNRHEAYLDAEIRRVLRPSGWFVTQQVGGGDLAELNRALGAGAHTYAAWDAATAADRLRGAGMDVVDQREEFVAGSFADVGAVVLFLQITPWQVPDFSIEDYDAALRRLHARIRAEGPLPVRHHRFLLAARAPA